VPSSAMACLWVMPFIYPFMATIQGIGRVRRAGFEPFRTAAIPTTLYERAKSLTRRAATISLAQSACVSPKFGGIQLRLQLS
jgi:hypothetical protein